MPYIHPSLVISPKASISKDSVTVVYDGGEVSPGDPWTGWSVAEMEWDGNPAVGMRWNGGGTSIGNPQSRGVPTWFILPDPIAEVVLKAVRER